MNYKAPKNYKAQVMLMTLLVMSILAVIIIGVLQIINRDVLEVTTNQKYEEALNVSENNLNKVIQKYATAASIDTIMSDNEFPDCSPSGDQLPSENKYECEISDTSLSGLNLLTNLELLDTKDISNYELSKDEALTVNLNGYNQTIEVTWTGDYAMEVTLIARNAGGQYVTISDLYDRHGVFNSPGSTDPILDPDNFHDFNFTGPTDPGLINNGFRVNIATITGLGANVPQKLIVTPRSKLNLDNSNITVIPSNYINYPFQLRVFRAESFDLEEESTPVARVNSEVSLTPQLDSIFNYSLLTKGQFSL